MSGDEPSGPAAGAADERYWNRLRFAAMRRCRDAARAEQIARQALEGVSRFRDGRDEDEEPLARRLLEAVRTSCSGVATPSRTGDPFRALVSEERREEVAHLLGTLEGKDRDVLEMSLRDGLEGAELSRRLGADAETVSARRDAALAHVAECLGVDFRAPCPAGVDPDVPVRYLRGDAGPESAAQAFESHYFTCDRCWARLLSGNAARTAMLRVRPARSLTGPATAERGPRLLVLLALLAAAAMAFWQVVCRSR